MGKPMPTGDLRRDPGTPGADRRRFILELLDGTRERHDSAHAGTESDGFVYFAHLNAVWQLTEILNRRLLKPHRLSDSEYRVLDSLRLRGANFRATPLELNRFAQITSAGMTRTLDRLEQAGYIDRSPNPEDRRSILVGLTPAGRAFADLLVRDLEAKYAEILGPLTGEALKAEIDQIRVVVERLAHAVIR